MSLTILGLACDAEEVEKERRASRGESSPLDESMIVEFCFQIFGSESEAENYTSALREVVAPIFGPVGRYECRTALTSAEDGQFDEMHSASRRRRSRGQSLFDVRIAVRGFDDRDRLSDTVFQAVHEARLDWEQMTTTYISGPYLEGGLTRYPSLRLDHE